MSSLKTQVKSILEKEKISFWDLEIILKYVFTALNQCKDKKTEIEGQKDFGWFRHVSREIEDDIQLAIIKSKTISETLVKLQDEIYEQVNKNFNEIDAKVTEYHNKVNNLNKKLENKKLIFPEIKLPYNMAEAVELAQKVANLSDAELEVLRKLTINKQKI